MGSFLSVKKTLLSNFIDQYPIQSEYKMLASCYGNRR